jgi:hypothetical protein
MKAIKPLRCFAPTVLTAAPASVDEAVAEAAVLAASNFFDVKFSCSVYRPADPFNNNDSEFCNRRIEAEADHARLLGLTDPPAADRAWERVYRDIVDQAPWLPTVTPTWTDFLSKRAGDGSGSKQTPAVAFEGLRLQRCNSRDKTEQMSHLQKVNQYQPPAVPARRRRESPQSPPAMTTGWRPSHQPAGHHCQGMQTRTGSQQRPGEAPERSWHEPAHRQGRAELTAILATSQRRRPC